jgi:hypothetical protein
MPRPMIGKLTPRYSFILNPYPNERLSKCPRCIKPTHPRKFPLFIHVKEWGPVILGKTCRYCSRCELIIAHQHELEAELEIALLKHAPRAIGNEYLVIGTMERKSWQRGLEAGAQADPFAHVADFAEVLELVVKPGGWGAGMSRC